MRDNHDSPEPVEGIEYPFSTMKVLAFSLMTLVLCGIGIGILAHGVTRVQMPEGREHYVIIWQRVLLGGVMVGSGLVGLIYYARNLLLSPCLIVADDRLQVLETNCNPPRVALEIPFENIDSVQFVRWRRVALIAIDLIDPDDEDTFARWRRFKLLKRTRGCHYLFHNLFEQDLQTIVKTIQRSHQIWGCRTRI